MMQLTIILQLFVMNKTSARSTNKHTQRNIFFAN
jgi:hypothetical protein